MGHIWVDAKLVNPLTGQDEKDSALIDTGAGSSASSASSAQPTQLSKTTYKCDFCDSTFATQKDFQTHLKLHEVVQDALSRGLVHPPTATL